MEQIDAIAKEQIYFLKKHNISNAELFDASGLIRQEYQLRMQEPFP